MSEPSVTYACLDKALRSLGFSVHLVSGGRTRLYRHADTGALVDVPALPMSDPVLPHHLVAARALVDAFGIADRLDIPTS